MSACLLRHIGFEIIIKATLGIGNVGEIIRGNLATKLIFVSTESLAVSPDSMLGLASKVYETGSKL